jgi:hypothetical protein
MNPCIKSTIRPDFIRAALLGGILLSFLSGCALFQPPCGLDCEAMHICNGLNQQFYSKKEDFEAARRATNSELARYYCVWREGLVLPKGKESWGKTHNNDPDARKSKTQTSAYTK